MIRISAGTFSMGCSAEEAEMAYFTYDHTIHNVTLTRDFWLSRTEITQDEYLQQMGTNPSHFAACGGDCPVDSVAWVDAVSFANARSRSEGLADCYDVSGNVIDGATVYDCVGYRLPTEAEWEYAARAGTTTATWAGDLTIVGEYHALELEAIARYGGNSGVTYEHGEPCSDWPERAHNSTSCGPQSVETTAATPWGIKGMLGNVYEWIHDGASDYSDADVIDPVGTPVHSFRALRGCAWSSRAGVCHSAARSSNHYEHRHNAIGFRLARTAPM